ncbi:RNA-directed RNA polymerase [Salix suchowensis]|nr:RNA-directed RNA polymerase [Salix suchowensis]
MGWLQSLISPLKKLWFRLHSTPKNRRGIYILYEDVKSCQYEDVHVLWSILVDSNTPSLLSKQ